MTLPRYAARRDENEPEIVEALQAAGWAVHRTNAPGFPDLVCARGRRIVLIEVIGDQKAKKYRKSAGLTPAQVAFHRSWPGVIHKVRSPAEALQVVGALGRDS